jgi:hypothetical protein
MILDNFLNEVAKALAGSSYVYPAYLTVGTGTTALSTSSTALSGEVGDARRSMTITRSANVVDFSAVRPGSDVNSSSGEYLNELGIFSALTSGTMLSALSIPSLLQTTAYDIEISGSFTVNRQ